MSRVYLLEFYEVRSEKQLHFTYSVLLMKMYKKIIIIMCLLSVSSYSFFLKHFCANFKRFCQK